MTISDNTIGFCIQTVMWKTHTGRWIP